MKRYVHDKGRYYSLEILPNLFGECVLLRTYGSMNRFKPTGVKSEVFSTAAGATLSMESWICKKKKKGYI